MRTQWCREHIDQVAEACGLEKSTVSDVKQADKFCEEHSDLSDCSTRAIMALIRIRDAPVREKVISSIEKAFESERHPLTGAFLKKKVLTEREIKKIIERADLEVRKEFFGDRKSPAGKFDKYLDQNSSPDRELEKEPGSNSTASELDDTPAGPDIETRNVSDEYLEKYPETADCLESGCLKIKKVRADLHICEVTGIRPENMLGKFPVGCYKRKPESVSENDDTPGYQEYLNRQLPHCRQRKCPDLIDEEGDVMADCKVMARREEEGKPWRRNGCPLTPKVPPPKEKGTAGVRAGTKRDPVKLPEDLPDKCMACGKWPTCKAAGPGEKGCVYKIEKPQQREFLVMAVGEDLDLLQKLVDRGDADKIEDTPQLVFDAGIQVLREKLEVR